jgi:hypothetical protein
MADPCPFGGAPAPGAPEWDSFDFPYLSGVIGTVASLASNAAMGLPIGPFEVAGFCQSPNIGDLPGDEDYVKLAFPPLALVSGTYTRFGNQAKMDKYAEICVCLGNPAAEVCYDPTQPGGTWTTHTDNGGPVRHGVGFNVTGAFTCTGGSVWLAAQTPNIQTTMYLYNVTAEEYVGIYQAPGALWGAGRHDFSWSAGPVTLVPGDYYVMIALYHATHTHYHTPLWDTHPAGDAVNIFEFYEWTSGIDPDLVAETFGVPLSPRLCAVEALPNYDPDPPPALEPPTGYPEPPDTDCSDGESICNKLDMLASKIDLAIARVDLIQRQLVPFAYVPGASHTGLAGQGSIAVQGILGLSVELTTLPAWIGSEGSTVPTLINAGWITLGTPDGNLPSRPITHDNFVLLDVSGAITWVFYDFPPGVVATITELIREP